MPFNCQSPLNLTHEPLFGITLLIDSTPLSLGCVPIQLLTILVFFSSEHGLGEDDIYDCVPCEDDGDDIYEDIIKVEVRQPMVRTLCHNPCNH